MPTLRAVSRHVHAWFLSTINRDDCSLANGVFQHAKRGQRKHSYGSDVSASLTGWHKLAVDFSRGAQIRRQSRLRRQLTHRRHRAGPSLVDYGVKRGGWKREKSWKQS
jgi:hypothetical protein